MKSKDTDSKNYEREAFGHEICADYAGEMQLRDWFAGQALIGLLGVVYSQKTSSSIAREAYGLADAMIKERGNLY